MTGEEANKQERENAARKLDIFLDYLLSLATSTTSFLLNPKYDALLEDGQRTLRNSLIKFIEEIPPAGKKAPEYQLLEKLFRDLGLQKQKNRDVLNSSKSPDPEKKNMDSIKDD